MKSNQAPYAVRLFLVTLGLLYFSSSADVAYGEGAAVPIVERQALASTKGGSVGVLLLGIDTKYFSRFKILSGSIGNKARAEFKNGVGVLISAELAQQLSLRAGEVVALVNPIGGITGIGAVPSITRYRVLAIVDDEAFTANNGVAYL